MGFGLYISVMKQHGLAVALDPVLVTWDGLWCLALFMGPDHPSFVLAFVVYWWER